MNQSMQILGAATLALVLLAPAAWAGENDQAGQHNAHAGEPHKKMAHDQMSHGQMDHGAMDHSQMNGMDHSKMDHGAMHKDAKPKADSNDDR
ncbi:hypothetical protein [Pseudomonas sp. Q1-7]|uniref:hypothetical protein n=1 Tax=Pseudomonas sp. Q1-7 TaxID=3020843 RepID=UPI0022FFF6C8|nr:hypothetical protein [Pseudomonas sp. Q1-7]